MTCSGYKCNPNSVIWSFLYRLRILMHISFFFKTARNVQKNILIFWPVQHHPPPSSYFESPVTFQVFCPSPNQPSKVGFDKHFLFSNWYDTKETFSRYYQDLKQYILFKCHIQKMSYKDVIYKS